MLEDNLSFEITDDPDHETLSHISNELVEFNTREVGPSGRQRLVILIRDEKDAIVGGLSGFTAWGWLCTELLWVAGGHRGSRLGSTLLVMAEDEARERGCRGAWLDTFNPQARRFYEQHGYRVFGDLPDFPQGRSLFFLRKRL